MRIMSPSSSFSCSFAFPICSKNPLSQKSSDLSFQAKVERKRLEKAEEELRKRQEVSTNEFVAFK